jgi:hypothetical protein
MGTGCFSPGLKRPGHEADHSPVSSAEFQNGGDIPALPHTSPWRGASLLILKGADTPSIILFLLYHFMSFFNLFVMKIIGITLQTV